MNLTKGSRLGPYEILAPLGAGGMGEVYRARDTRLGRAVAIKVLSSRLSHDSKLRLRFAREAKAISNLSHPHICALYDVGEIPAVAESGESTWTPYIVMEYLEGETVADRLKRGALPTDQVLRHGIEIAGALDAAHRNRVLHRDLKPSNIMITKSGARLLDFGLAKFISHPVAPGSISTGGEPRSLDVVPQDLSDRSTAEKSLTEEGSVIGTLEYMAPEQLEGKEPDARTDIFALGVCLYEMTTGHRPFRGNSRANVIAAILEQDPEPLLKYCPQCPPDLEWLIRTCLAKDPDDRMQTAHDVMLYLKRITKARSEAMPASSRPRRIPAWVGWTAAAAAVVAIGLIAALSNRKWRPDPAPGVPKQFTIALPSSAPVAPPLSSGDFEKLAVAPDSHHLVYVGGSNPTRLYLHSLDTSETRMLPHTEGARGPFFSPDGEWVGFYTGDGDLKKVAVRGGAPVTLSTNRDLRGATWGTDDTIVFAELRSPLRKISARGGTPAPLTSQAATVNMLWPVFLPDGRHILYTANDVGADYDKANLMVLSLNDGTSKVVFRGATYGRYVRSGHLVFLRSGVLFAAPLNLRTMEVSGTPAAVVSDVDFYYARGLAHFAISADGSLFHMPRDAAESKSELVWVDRGGTAVPVTPLRRPYDEPRLSPDGSQILVTIGARGDSDLWVYDLNRDAWTRLTTEATNSTGLWSPDGKQIVFASSRDGGFNLYLLPSDGSAAPRRMTFRSAWVFPSSWSPDGRTIAVVESYRKTLTDIYMVPFDRPDTPTALRTSPFDEHGSAFSPDGKWLAYQSTETGKYEVYVQPYTGLGRKWAVSTAGGTNPEWRRDGRELFYRDGDRLMGLDVTLTPELRLGKPRVLFQGDFQPDYDIAPDGRRFLMVRRGHAGPRTQIKVVVGIFANPTRFGS